MWGQEWAGSDQGAHCFPTPKGLRTACHSHEPKRARSGCARSVHRIGTSKWWRHAVPNGALVARVGHGALVRDHWDHVTQVMQFGSLIGPPTTSFSRPHVYCLAFGCSRLSSRPVPLFRGPVRSRLTSPLSKAPVAEVQQVQAFTLICLLDVQGRYEG